MRTTLALLLLFPAAFAACSGGEEPAGTAATGVETTAPAPGRERIVIETDEGAVEVHAELADDDLERQTGLMGRESLDPDGGMLFVFDEDVDGAFWMKDTLIPLSIAFVSADGEILRILEMKPCTADPCPVYDPETSYRLALEVNGGAFDRWGVRKGDTLLREDEAEVQSTGES